MKLRLTISILLFLLFVQANAQETLNGPHTVDGDLIVNGNLIVNGDLVVRGRIISTGAQRDVPAEDIFVSLWKTDQQHNGMSVTLMGSDGRWVDETADIRLDEQGVALAPSTDSAPRPMIVVHDDAKLNAATYVAVEKLFDNYVPDESESEDALGSNDVEDAEIEAFLNAVMGTEVTKQAFAFVNKQNLKPEGGVYTAEEFKALIKHQWFALFTNHFSNPKPHCSGFEHVFVGDHNRQKIGGHHFWWKFFLDQENGTADSLGHKYKGPRGEAYRWIATFRMKWIPEAGLTLTAPDQKGFFVGCSPELMIAFGTVGLLMEKKAHGAHPVVEFDGGKYELTVHASTLPGSSDPDDRRGVQVRSVFPKLLSASGGGPLLDATVAEALAAAEGQHLQVTGVIVEELNGEFGLKLADTVDSPQSLAVKLSATFRPEFNPMLNPSAKGKKIVIHARRGKYTGVPGLVDVTHIEFAAP